MKTATKITLLVSLFIGLFILFGPIKTERGVICRNTLSKSEYTEWFGHFRTGEHYTKSPIETYLEKKSSAPVKHDWVSYNGTTKNLFGSALHFSHGRPGAILQLGKLGHIESLSDERKAEIARTLSSHDEAAITKLVESLWEEALKRDDTAATST